MESVRRPKASSFRQSESKRQSVNERVSVRRSRALSFRQLASGRKSAIDRASCSASAVHEELLDDAADHWLKHVATENKFVRKGNYFVSNQQDERVDGIQETGDIEMLSSIHTLDNVDGKREGDHFYEMKTGEKEFNYERSGNKIFVLYEADNRQRCIPFLFDYTKRWNARMGYPTDSLSSHVPLLYASFLFVHNETVSRITICLLVYFLIGRTICTILYNGPESYIYQTIGLMLYVALGIQVLRGKLLKAKFDPDCKGIDKPSKRQNVFGAGNRHSSFVPKSFVSQLSYFVEAVIVAFEPKVNYIRRKERGRKVRSNGLLKTRGYIEVLDLATEYLEEVSTTQHSFKPRPYATTVVWVSLWLVLLFMSMHVILGVRDIIICATTETNNPREHASESRCDAVHFLSIYFLGYTLSALALGLSILNAAVTFAYLLYASDVSNALTMYWLHRFGPLRRITSVGTVSNTFYDTSCEELPTRPRVSETNPMPMNTLVSEKSSELSTNPLFSHANPMIADALKNANVDGAYEQQSIRVADIMPLIQRDACERYLFIHTFFKETTEWWQIFLAVTLVSSLVLIANAYITMLFLYHFHTYVSIYQTFFLVINGTIFTYVFACLCYANGAVDNILEGFMYAGDYDYTVLGGRNAMIEYVKQTPIRWLVYGVSINRKDIATYLGVLGAALSTALITAQLSGTELHLSDD